MGIRPYYSTLLDKSKFPYFQKRRVNYSPPEWGFAPRDSTLDALKLCFFLFRDAQPLRTMSVYFKIVIVLYLLEVVVSATLQRCPDAIACHLKCNDTNCQQYCKFPPCSMTCDGAIICYQFCYRGNCPMMECLNTQVIVFPLGI